MRVDDVLQRAPLLGPRVEIRAVQCVDRQAVCTVVRWVGEVPGIVHQDTLAVGV